MVSAQFCIKILHFVSTQLMLNTVVCCEFEFDRNAIAIECQKQLLMSRAVTKALIGGGGCIFIYSRSARRISFEINCNDN